MSDKDADEHTTGETTEAVDPVAKGTDPAGDKGDEQATEASQETTERQGDAGSTADRSGEKATEAPDGTPELVGAAGSGDDNGSAKQDAAAATDDGRTGGFRARLRRIPIGGRRTVITGRIVVALLLVASLTASVFLFLQKRNTDAVMTAREEARAAACEYAPVLANYDGKNLDPYFGAVLAGATGEWKKQFESTSTELREVLAQGEVVSTAGVVQCAITSVDENSAEAVVVIGQTITSMGTQGQPTPGQLAMVMRMQRGDGRWLVNQMEAPLAPATQP